MKLGARLGLVWIALVVPSAVCGFEPDTHRDLTVRATDVSSLDAYLRSELKFSAGLDQELNGTRVRRLIREGAFFEDFPSFRSFNHFHNPRVIPWSGAGLATTAASGKSSVLWQQTTSQDSATVTLFGLSIPVGGGDWSWQDTRRRYLEALTGAVGRDGRENALASVRESTLADVFRGLGHVVHLVQDAAVPAHTRNDPHPGFVPGQMDLFEKLMEVQRVTAGSAFLAALASAPLRPPATLLGPTGDPAADVPIARLIDANRFVNEDFRLLSGSDLGLAEYSAGNFLSRDTIFQEGILPRRQSLGPAFFEPDGSGFRLYFPKVAEGEIDIRHFVASGMLYRDLELQLGSIPQGGWVLDRRVHEDYARKLVPRAVGYSAALLDYFFRGKLDVELVPDPADPSMGRIDGVNASTEPLVAGTLTLYADNAQGRRMPVPAVEPSPVANIAPGQPIRSARFRPSDGDERFTVVYQGTLGDEIRNADRGAVGAVIGKVLGGVRVEHIFADGANWKIRTPAGVFPLPLRTSEFEEVKWGSGTDVLVARTPFGDGFPNRFASFAVERRPGSMDLVINPGSGMLTLRPLANAVFPFGVPVVTTARFDQTIHYRQQLGIVNPFRRRMHIIHGLTYGWTGRGQAVAPEIREVEARTFRFADSFAVRLDTSHSITFNPFGASQYLWDVFGFTGDADGRIHALVQVLLGDPALPAKTVDYLGFHARTGVLEKHATAYIRPVMPVDTGPIWALVDVRSGQVVASTAGSDIVITSEVRVEPPPFGISDHVRLEGFEQPNAPGIWLKIVDTFEGGLSDGVTAEIGWFVAVVTPFPEDRMTIRANVEARIGLQSVGATGLQRDEIAAVLPVSTAIAAKETTRTLVYLEENTGSYNGLRLRILEGVIPGPPQLFDGRMLGAGALPKVAFIGQDSDAAGGATHVITWDPQARRAAVVADLPRGSHGLTAATSSTALVNSYLAPGSRPAGFVVRLDEPKPPLAFPGESMWSFTVLEPGYLYNGETMKFYRLKAPLQRTALPASLAGRAGPSGDFHAIQLP